MSSNVPFIDYKKPVDPHNDFRTSTYVGHKHMVSNAFSFPRRTKETKFYTTEPDLLKDRVTEYKGSYVWQYVDAIDQRNPTLDAKQHFMKPFEECNLMFLKRPMRPPASSSHEDYVWHPEARVERPQPKHMASPIPTTRVTVNFSQPSYGKYLDPAATTNRLAYPHRTPDEIAASSARNDNITFWNWKKFENKPKHVYRVAVPLTCDYAAPGECPHRREFTSLLKRVPHSGLTTEVRQNYVDHGERKMGFDQPCIRNQPIWSHVEPSQQSTEQNMYGSGECTMKYV